MNIDKNMTGVETNTSTELELAKQDYMVEMYLLAIPGFGINNFEWTL